MLSLTQSFKFCLKQPKVSNESSLKPVQCEHVVLRESRAEDEGDERKADFVWIQMDTF